MTTIAVIGSGQLGSRHIQAIVKERQPYNIEVVEPSLEAQKMTQARLDQVEFGHPETRVSFIKELSNISIDCDIGIVATGSSNRAEIVADLIEKIGIKRLLLEKVLFQRIEDYFRIGKLITDHNVKAWVNCPRRIYPDWIKIKESINNKGPLYLSVSGGDWGLACNAIHFIDLAAFLGCSMQLKYSTKGLDKQWIWSKRPGYREITGLLQATSIRGDQIVLFSGAGQDVPSTIAIEVPGERYIVNEATSSLLTSSISDSWLWHEAPFSIKYQSELTGRVISQILSEDDCPLTKYNESSEMHIGLIEALLRHFNPYSNILKDDLPIT